VAKRRIQKARRDGRLGYLPSDEVLDRAIGEILRRHYAEIDRRIAAGENRVVARDPFRGTETVHEVPSWHRAPRRRLKIAIERRRYRRANPAEPAGGAHK
jgi:hypothetical protein